MMATSADQQPDHNLGGRYWDNVAEAEPTNNGVLGGFGTGSLPRVDSLSSRLFILSLFPQLSFPPTPVRCRALEIGAGIGRVTRDVLVPVLGPLATIEMVEPAAGFVTAAFEAAQKQPFKTATIRMWQMRTQDFWHRGSDHAPVWSVGSQETVDEGKKYDLIWCQWWPPFQRCLGHLSDDELVVFLERSASELDPSGGVIVVKENVLQSRDRAFDDVDGSITRSDDLFRKLFHLAGLVVFRQDVQLGFPEELLRVNIYALKPFMK